MRTKLSLVLTAVLLASTVLFFQNCAKEETKSAVTTLASVTPPAPPDIIFLSIPPPESIRYLGSPAALAVLARSEAGLPISYQWSKAGLEMPGQTANGLGIPAVALTDEGDYSIKVTTDLESRVLNFKMKVSPVPVLTITTQPLPLTLDVAGTAGLSVVASVSDMQVLRYQWFKDTIAIAGATSAQLVIPGLGPARSGFYFVAVSTSLGPPQKINSNSVRVTATQTFNVDSATGCVRGFCACVTGGQPNVPDRPSALAICVFKGYADVTVFATRQSGPGPLHCNADGTSCFVNAAPSNLLCTSVSCTK